MCIWNFLFCKSRRLGIYETCGPIYFFRGRFYVDVTRSPLALASGASDGVGSGLGLLGPNQYEALTGQSPYLPVVLVLPFSGLEVYG